MARRRKALPIRPRSNRLLATKESRLTSAAFLNVSIGGTSPSSQSCSLAEASQAASIRLYRRCKGWFVAASASRAQFLAFSRKISDCFIASSCCEGHRRRARAYSTVFDDTFSTLMNGCSGRFFHFPESWFDMRVSARCLITRSPCPPAAGDQVASQDHRRSVVMRRRHETSAPAKFAPRTRTDDPVTLMRLILRRMRQRAFVLLGPTPDRTRGRGRRRADISETGRPRHRRLDPVASLDVLDARSSTFLTHDPRLL